MRRIGMSGTRTTGIGAVLALLALLALLGAACANPVGVDDGRAPASSAVATRDAAPIDARQVVATSTASTVVLTNRGGNCRTGAATDCFTYLSDGTYAWFSTHGYVVLYYTSGASREYAPFVSSLGGDWTGTFSGVDPAGRAFSASVVEHLTRYYSRGGGGRGGGGAGWHTAITSGSVTFHY